MVADEILYVWIGGPMDGQQRYFRRRDVKAQLGRELICGSVTGERPAVYRVDKNITIGQVCLRFVRLLPGR